MKVKARFLLLALMPVTFVALPATCMTGPNVNAADEAHSPFVLATNTTSLGIPAAMPSQLSQSAPSDPPGLVCWFEDESTYCCITQYGRICVS